MTTLRIFGLAYPLLALGASVLFAACARPVEAEEPLPLNVLVVVLDHVRADRMASYGYHRATTPSFDAYAQHAALFENAVTESTWGTAARASLMTGLYPTSHGLIRPNLELPASTLTLAEILQGAGYVTAAFCDSREGDGKLGLERGFLIHQDQPGTPVSAIHRAESFVDEIAGDRPFLLYLQTDEAGAPYDPAPAFQRHFLAPHAEHVATGERRADDYTGLELSPGQLQHISDRYDSGLFEVDTHLGTFLRRLRRDRVLENTLVVITSSHGEALGEHGKFGNAESLARECLRIPLLIGGPGIPPGRIEAPVGLVDVVPTVLDVLELPVPLALEGRSLIDLANGTEPRGMRPDYRISELGWPVPRQSILTSTHHLLIDLETGESELFDLVADPHERRSLRLWESPVAEQMSQYFAQHRAAHRGAGEVGALRIRKPEAATEPPADPGVVEDAEPAQAEAVDAQGEPADEDAAPKVHYPDWYVEEDDGGLPSLPPPTVEDSGDDGTDG